MEAYGIIVWLIIGAIAGWLAGLLVKGGGYGLIVDIIVGIVGALIGGWLVPPSASPSAPGLSLLSSPLS